MRALVIGARGAVGASIASTLREWGHDVTPAGRRAPDGGVALDLASGSLDPLRRLAREHDVVVNASGAENPLLGQWTGEAVLIDISATGGYLSALAANAPAAPIVLGAGLAPGLSTVLVSELRSSPGDVVDVAVLLGSGEKHGAAAVDWTAGLIGSEIAAVTRTEADGAGPVYNFRSHRCFADPGGGRRRYLRADFPDHALIGRARDLQLRSWLALSSPAATRALALVARVPKLRGVVNRVPAFGSSEWAVAASNRRTGERRAASGVGQSDATARITALAAVAAAAAKPLRPVTLDALLGSADIIGALAQPLAPAAHDLSDPPRVPATPRSERGPRQ